MECMLPPMQSIKPEYTNNSILTIIIQGNIKGIRGGGVCVNGGGKDYPRERLGLCNIRDVNACFVKQRKRKIKKSKSK